MGEILEFNLSDASEDQLESLEDSSNRLIEAGNERQRYVAQLRLNAIHAERRCRQRKLRHRLRRCGLQLSVGS